MVRRGELGALECVSLAAAIWKVELGPRSGTAREIGGFVTGFSTLRARIAAAGEAAKERWPRANGQPADRL